MLSIVICSVNPKHLESISDNIEETIGIPYELIPIDNRNSPRGICAVYNEGVKSAKYDHICFVHEDVRFKTTGWGKALQRVFQDPTIGLIGVAGAAHKPRMISGWGAEGLPDRLVKINLIQHFDKDKKKASLQYQNTGKEKLAEVACVDGLFLASTKEILQEIPFDEELLKGFHGYDIDISMAIGCKYKVVVSYDILVEHFSQGSLNMEWLKNSLLVHEKWASELPRSVQSVTRKEKAICEKRTYRFLLQVLKKNNTFSHAFKILHTGELITLDVLTYLKMYISLAKVYFPKQET